MFSRLLMVAGCATALSLMPVMSSGFDTVPDGLSSDAYAQGKSGSAGGGNGGGNSGGGNSGGGSSASAGGHGGGKANAFGGAARKSGTQAASARGNGAGNGNGQAQTIGELFGNFLKGDRGKPEGAGQQAAERAPKAKAAAPTTRAAKAAPAGPKAQQQAVLPREVPVPEARPDKELNFHAKLAGLNSLNRNYEAYLNAQDPRMTAIREYVVSSAEYDMTTAEREALESELASAQEALNTLIEGIEPYDEYTYDDTSVEALEDRLATLDGVNTDTMSDEELAAYNAEYDALTSALASEELASLQETQDALDAIQEELAALEGEITDEALTEALLAAANDNRVAEYGDDYVDEEMLNWAKSLLGVGEEDGKIDEVRTVLESEETSEEGEEDILIDEVETGDVAG